MGAAALERELARAEAERDRIFTRLEAAVTDAMTPLGEMFGDVGLPPDRVLSQMRRQYSGQGGPLHASGISAKNAPSTAAEVRAETILAELDRLNLFRIAADKVPFARPFRTRVRKTSGFGPRRHPVLGGTRMHEGIDWSGDHGAPILASADGVVTHAGWLSGYGRIVKIKHAFGIETRFAHLARIDVSVGQRVSRGERIGAMGNSGRSTGTHLHYEIRVGGEPLVLLHGTPFSSDEWHRVAPILARYRRVYLYDMLGYGRSDKRAGQDVSLGAQTRLLEAFLEHFGLDRPDVLAHDFGGAIALRAHLLDGVDYRRLLLVDPVAARPWGSPFVQHVREHEAAFAGLPD